MIIMQKIFLQVMICFSWCFLVVDITLPFKTEALSVHLVAGDQVTSM